MDTQVFSRAILSVPRLTASLAIGRRLHAHCGDWGRGGMKWQARGCKCTRHHSMLF